LNWYTNKQEILTSLGSNFFVYTFVDHKSIKIVTDFVMQLNFYCD